MGHSNALISTAMLCAFLENNKKDALDLLSPFIMYCVGKTTKLGDYIDLDKVTNLMESEFAFDNFPEAVAKKIIIRETLNKELGKISITYSQFKLDGDLENTVKEFEEKRLKIKERSDIVFRELKDYLQANLCDTNISIDDTKEIFEKFLQESGFEVLRSSTLALSLEKVLENKHMYQVASFFMKCKEEESCTYEYMLEIIKGSLIADALYINEDAENDTKPDDESAFCELEFYFDTMFIMNALGYMGEKEESNAKYILEILRARKAKLCLFEHNFDEVYRNIDSYRNALENGTTHTRPIPYFQENDYGAAQIQLLILKNLRENIESRDIKIIPKPIVETNTSELHASINIRNSFIKENDLSNIISRGREKEKERALECDVASIFSVFLLRNGVKTSKLEKCRAIFVTTNNSLARDTNRFIKKEHYRSGEILPTITDTNLTAVLWLRYYSSNTDVITMKITQNVAAMLDMPEGVINRMLTIAGSMEKKEEITILEARIIRSDTWFRNAVMASIKGDEKSLSAGTIKNVLEMYTDPYKKAIAAKDSKICKLQIEKEDLRKKEEDKEKRRLEKIKDMKANEIQNSYNVRKNDIENALKKWEGRLRISTVVIFIFLIFVHVFTIQEFNTAVTIITIISGVSIYDTVVSKRKFILSLIKKNIIKKQDKIHKEKIREINNKYIDFMSV